MLPHVNLVSNIGFGSDGTHPQGESKFANMSNENIGKMFHPPFVIWPRQADIYTFDYLFGANPMRDIDTLYGKVSQTASSAKHFKC